MHEGEDVERQDIEATGRGQLGRGWQAYVAERWSLSLKVRGSEVCHKGHLLRSHFGLVMSSRLESSARMGMEVVGRSPELPGAGRLTAVWRP